MKTVDVTAPSAKLRWAGRSISAVAILIVLYVAIFQLVFPDIVGTLLWAGVLVRDAQLRALIPLRSKSGKPS
jgi:hypothetical protein